jgi:hypothetical protein
MIIEGRVEHSFAEFGNHWQKGILKLAKMIQLDSFFYDGLLGLVKLPSYLMDPGVVYNGG